MQIFVILSSKVNYCIKNKHFDYNNNYSKLKYILLLNSNITKYIIMYTFMIKCCIFI